MKDKFEILNNVKINIDEYREIEFDDNEEFKNKMKNKIKSEKCLNKKRIAIAGIGILVGSMVIVSEPSLEYIKNIGQQIEYFFNREDNTFNGYKVEVNQVVEDKGIEIELKEIMLGDGELLLSLKVDDSKLDKSYFGIDKSQDSYASLYEPKVQIGDMVFANTGGGSMSERGDELSRNMLLTCDLNALDTNNDGEADVEGFDLISNLDINKNYDVKVEINKVEYTIENSDINSLDTEKLPDYMTISEINGGGANADTGESFETRSGGINGNWNFETSINAKKVLEDIEIYEVNKNIKIKEKDLEIDIVIEEVRVSPTKIKIKHSFKTNKENTIDGEELTKFLKFVVKDENGNEIEVRGGLDLSADEELIKNNPFVEGEVSRDMKQIKIIPAIDDWSKKINPTKTFDDKAITIELK